jgi:hypothetical protein
MKMDVRRPKEGNARGRQSSATRRADLTLIEVLVILLAMALTPAASIAIREVQWQNRRQVRYSLNTVAIAVHNYWLIVPRGRVPANPPDPVKQLLDVFNNAATLD